ncbi:MAG: protein YgfX [Betaproteobacteria bacterium]
MRDPAPLRIDLEPSSLRRLFIGVAYSLTAILVGALPLALDLRVWTILLVVALVARAWSERPPAALIVRLDGTLALLRDDGASIEAVLVNGGYLGTRFATLVYRPLGRRRSSVVTIFSDMLATEDFRRLRVRLNYASSDDDDGVPASHARASTSAPLSALR